MAASDQLKSITDALRDYFEGISEFVSGDSDTVPMFVDVVPSLVYDEILTDGLRGEKLAANFTTGALVDTVQFVIGIKREFSLRSKSKAQFYVDAEVEYQTDSDYYEHLYPTYYNMYRGKAPEQT